MRRSDSGFLVQFSGSVAAEGESTDLQIEFAGVGRAARGDECEDGEEDGGESVKWDDVIEHEAMEELFNFSKCGQAVMACHVASVMARHHIQHVSRW